MTRRSGEPLGLMEEVRDTPEPVVPAQIIKPQMCFVENAFCRCATLQCCTGGARSLGADKTTALRGALLNSACVSWCRAPDACSCSEVLVLNMLKNDCILHLTAFAGLFVTTSSLLMAALVCAAASQNNNNDNNNKCSNQDLCPLALGLEITANFNNNWFSAFVLLVIPGGL